MVASTMTIKMQQAFIHRLLMVHQIANLILQITKPIKMNMMIKSMVKMVIKLMKMHISSPSQTMSKSKTRVEKKLRTKR